MLFSRTQNCVWNVIKSNHPEDGDSSFLGNASRFLQERMTSHLRRLNQGSKFLLEKLTVPQQAEKFRSFYAT
jgi:hypothetical protein